MTAQRVLLTQGTDRWHAFRREHIGGSDAPIIAGESPYSSPFALWEEKVHGIVPESDPTRDLLFRIGHHMEPMILDLFEEKTGQKVPRRGDVFEDGWRSASIDGMTDSGEIVEAKWSSSSTRWADGVPADVVVQVTHQMAVLGVEVAHVAVLAGRTFEVYPVRFDPRLWESVSRLEEDFIHRVIMRDPPPVDGSEPTRRALVARHPSDDGEMIPGDDEIGRIVRSLRTARANAEILEGEIGGYENALRFLIGDKAGIEGPDYRVTYRKSKDSLRVDWQAVATDLRMIVPEVEYEIRVDAHSRMVEGTRRLLVKAQEVEG